MPSSKITSSVIRGASVFRILFFDRYRKWPTTGSIALLAGLLLASYSICEYLKTPQAETLLSPQRWHRVQRVIDGDTLLLTSGHRLRLLGVNTPETKHPQLGEQPGGKQATQFTTDWISDEPVRLRFDRDKRDHFGRYLVYVLRGEECLNTELIRAGWSEAQLRLPLSAKWKTQFAEAELEAQQEKAGLWSAEFSVPALVPADRSH